MDNKKSLKKARDLSNSLKTDPQSVIFAEEIPDNKLLKKYTNKLKYETDKLLFKLVNFNDNKSIFDENKAPARADFVEKREIGCSTLYSFDGPSQLLHAGKP